jgi:putative restriction endonuclease
MRSDERAAQLWSLLILAARNQQILSYGMIEHLTGLPMRALGKRLHPIQEYCRENGLPPLTSIAVTETSGVPGEGFTGAPIEEVFRAQARVFVFDWFNHRIPFPIAAHEEPED